MPLCHESQSVPQGLPPSYETVMASEKAFLNKYTEAFRTKRCCKHPTDGTENERQACVATVATEHDMVIEIETQVDRVHNVS